MYNSIIIDPQHIKVLVVDKYKHKDKEVAKYVFTDLNDAYNFFVRFYKLKMDVERKNLNKGYIIIQTNINSAIPIILEQIQEVLGTWEEEVELELILE